MSIKNKDLVNAIAKLMSEHAANSSLWSAAYKKACLDVIHWAALDEQSREKK